MNRNNYSSTLWVALLLLIGISFSTTSQAQVQSMPYSQDFETFSTCTGSCGSACTLSSGWLNPTDDQTDWTVDIGGTSSGSTGPSVDHNPGTSAGNYLYFETSSPCNGGDDTAHLVSPPIDLAVTNGWGVSYWYHMYGATMGELHVDVSNDGGTTWTLDVIPVESGDKGDVWLYNEISLVPWLGDTVQIRWRGVSGSSFTSDMAIDDIASFAIVPLDAGVSAIPAPTSPAVPGMNNVDAVISNFGTDTLVSANVDWAVNGVAQPTLSWAGSILPGASSTALSLGMANFPTGFSAVKAWTTAPNGGADQSTSNDTLEVSILACNSLSGSYTLGGAGADYATFSDAAFALMNCGIGGPVTINVNPGTYIDHLELGEISGASATNTITFDGGSAAGTTIIWDGSGGIGTVELMGTDYITIQNLTLQNTAILDAWGVHLLDTAEFVTIDNCTILMDPSGTNDVDGILSNGSNTSAFTEGLGGVHTTITNNTIVGGDKSIHFEGAFATPYPTVGTVIMNNTFDNPDETGIYLDNMDSTTIVGNTLTGTRSNFGDGIYTFDQQNFTITDNNIIASDWGIYISDGNFDYPGSGQSLIANNMVSAATDDALYLDDVWRVNVYHNTFVGIEGAYLNDVDTLDIRNNIFASPTGKAIDFLDATTVSNVLTLDYNLYYTGGANLADDGTTTYTDLATWQAGSPALNISSVEGNPVFVSNYDDLHLLGTAANDVGIPIPLITSDIDGDARSATTPDIGADEYTPLTDDASPVAILTPTSFLCGDNVQEVEVVIFNGGANTITTMPVNADVTGDVTATLNFTYNGSLVAFAYDTIVIGTINTFNGGTFDVSLSTALAGDQDPSDDTLATQTYTVYPVVPTPAEDTVLVCGLDSATVMANAFIGANYEWYDSITGGNLVGTGPSFTIPSIATQGSYYLGYGSLQDDFTTTFAGGNGQSGNMFDVTALSSSITIDSLDIHIGGTATETVEVYFTSLPGGFAANAATPANWTLVGTQSVTGAGIGNPTQVTNMTPILIPAGSTYGIYVTLTTSTNIDYTNGTTGDFLVNNDIRIDFGAGLSYPFGSLINVRIWNGTLYYGAPACSDTRSMVTAVTDTLVSASFTSSAADLDGTFTDLSTGDPLTWTWDFGDGNTDSVASPMHSYQFPGTYTVSLIVADDCGVDTLSQTITVTCAAPGGGFTAVANDLEYTFTDTSAVGGVTPATYAWDFGDGGSSSMQNPVYTYAAPGTYTVCLTVVDTCGADTVCEQLIVTCAPPEAVFEFTTVEDTVSFFNASTGTDTVSVVWDFGDGTATSTDANPTHVYDSTGNYTVCLIATDVCGTDTSCIVVTFIKTGIDDLLYFSDLQVFPNPTAGQFVLQASISQPVGLRINLFDPAGKLVYQKEEGRVSGFYKQEFDLSHLSSGIYLLNLESEGRSTTLKLVRY